MKEEKKQDMLVNFMGQHGWFVGPSFWLNTSLDVTLTVTFFFFLV